MNSETQMMRIFAALGWQFSQYNVLRYALMPKDVKDWMKSEFEEFDETMFKLDVLKICGLTKKED